VRNVRKNFALEQLGEEDRPLGATGGTEPASLAGESDQELEAALGTKDPSEARFEESAVQVREDGGIPAGLPETVSPLESLLPQALEGFDVGIKELIEGAGAGVAGPLNGGAGLGPRQRPRSGAAHEGARRNPSSGSSPEDAARVRGLPRAADCRDARHSPENRR
jgi:hypothetical protein